MNQAMDTYLLSIRGTLAPSTLEGGRTIHNETAGAPANVAAARSLGDLSHMVYAPIPQQGAKDDEFLILDIWNNMDGLNQFFANPQVQEQAGQIFKQRDPVVWVPAEGFYSYHFPTPFGKNDRITAVVRGMVKSRAEAQAIHNMLVGKTVNKARANGNVSHDCYWRLTPPGSPESLEFFAVDVWMDGEGMGKHYQDPDFIAAFPALFAETPSTSVWTHPAGTWVEW